MKQDMSTTKSTEQVWSQLHSLTFHFHCCRQLCLSKCISSHNRVGSSILWTYAQDINGHITKIMVCLDPVGTLDSSTIEVPFNLDGEGKCFTNYRFQHCNMCTDINMFRIWQGNDSCVLEWQLCYAMTAVLRNDSCVTQWQLCYAMTAALCNDSCVTQWQLLCNDSCVMQWQLCYAMTAVLCNDSCVTEWQLCYGMTAVLFFDITMIKIWHWSKTVLPMIDWSYKIKVKTDTESQIQ